MIGRRSLVVGIVLAAAGLGILVFWRREPFRPADSRGGRAMSPSTNPHVPASAPPDAAVPAPKSPPMPDPIPQGADPAFRTWRKAVLQRDRRGIEDAEDDFRSREDAVRDSLMKMAVEDPDPRVRAFSVSVLGRFGSRPPEAYFTERLGDPHEFPRESAVKALQRFGTAACLPALDRVAASDPKDHLRHVAANAAKALRAKEAR